MAKLKAATRKKLPGKDFAGPGRSFPIEDKNHARAALSMVGRSSLSASAKAKVRSAAEAKLGARDGMGSGKGGLAVHSSAKGAGMHGDSRTMRHERY